MEKPKNGPPDKLPMIVDTARDQPRNLGREITPKLISLVLIQCIGIAADDRPRGLEYRQKGIDAGIGVPRLSSHGALINGPLHSVNAESPIRFRSR